MELLNTDEPNLYYCRFCSEKKRHNDLFSYLSNEVILEQIIHFTKKLQINDLNLCNDNNLPKTICTVCYNNIIQFNSFVIQIKQSQILLNEIYSIIKEESNHDFEIKYDENNSFSDNDDNSDLLLNTNKECLRENTLNQNLLSFTDSDFLEIKGLSRNKRLKQNDDSIKNEKEIKENTVINDSWSVYTWFCVHCKRKFTSMEEVRTHSKQEHKKCFGYNCVDCKEKFNMFNLFIDHVRQHRPSLRYYCQYCNLKSDTISQCFEHSTSHWQHGQKICKLCGEIMKDSKALGEHTKMFKKLRKQTRPRKVASGIVLLETGVEASWLDYNWSCQMCCQKLPDADMLRLHTQKVHNKCFAMKCMDCAMVMKNFTMFVAHVRIHRPYLKHFCQYCNTNLNKKSETLHMKNHEHGPKQPCSDCGQIFENINMLQKHMRQFIATRSAQSLTEADLTCIICKKAFTNIKKLRQHKKTHDTNRTRNYTCDTCGKAFFELGVLKSHKLTHSEKKFVCKLCQKAFHTKANLQEHAAMHLNEKPYQCDECGKGFNVKLRLKYHLSLHNGYKPHKCKVCGKAFRCTNDLKVHSRQHTGLRPFACEFCDRTFVNWPNYNKHMLVKHAICISKKKDKPKIEIDDAKKEWIYTLINNKHFSGAVATENKT